MPLNKSSHFARAIVGVGVVFALVASLVVGAAPAQAETVVAFAPIGGTVGTPAGLTSSINGGQAGVRVGTVTYYASGKVVATAAVDAMGKVSSASWTPLAAGSVPMYAQYASTDGTQAGTSATSQVTIAKSKTTTELTMPATAKIGSNVTVIAAVTAGAYIPTGSVTFLQPNDVVLTAAALDVKGAATITVRMSVTPSTYQLTARYNGDDNASQSTSKVASTLVTESGSNIALTVSPTPVTLGDPATLTAAITPSNAAGSVTFQAGSTVLGASLVSGGKAKLTWRPASPGAITITASFIPKGEDKPTGSDSLNLAVAGSRPGDTITMGPVGRPAWGPGAVYPLRYRSQVTLTATAKSGGTVTLSVTGPCALVGTTVTANAASGTCALTAKSPGSPALVPTTETTTIALARGRQEASLIAPATWSRLKRGSTYRLSLPSTVTTAETPVRWRVTYHADRCKVRTASDGGYLVWARKLGRCNVRAYAAPVPGQWLKFTKLYRYRVVR